MRGRYVVALSILGAYFIASYLILHGAIEFQRSVQRAVVMSGQQRMYSQRIAMFADAIAAQPSETERERARHDLETSIRIFSHAHRALTSGDRSVNPSGWPPSSVKRMYFDAPFDVDLQVREYLAHARAIEARSKHHDIRTSDPDLEYLLTVGPGSFLNSLDSVVHQYDREQRASVEKFEYLQLALLVLGLSTLGIIWFTILMPLENEILKKTAELERNAMLDPLTGLLNRTAFSRHVDDALALAKRRGERGAMLLIDLDRFKTINDSYGHITGDTAIVATAERLRAHVRTGEYACRLGGDEFAVFAPMIDDLTAFVERLDSALRFEIVYENTPLRVSASIGIARFPDDADSYDQLIARADRALYAAKNAGRGTFRYYAADEKKAPA